MSSLLYDDQDAAQREQDLASAQPRQSFDWGYTFGQRPLEGALDASARFGEGVVGPALDWIGRTGSGISETLSHLPRVAQYGSMGPGPGGALALRNVDEADDTQSHAFWQGVQQRAQEGMADYHTLRRQLEAPDPVRSNWASETLFGLSSILGSATIGGAVAGPVGTVGVVAPSYGVPAYNDLTEAGVDERTARNAGLIEGGAMAAMTFLPTSFGSRAGSIWVRVAERAAKGAAVNVPFGMSYRGALGGYLRSQGYTEQADRYKWNDGQAILSDAVIGAAFASLHGTRLPPRGERGPVSEGGSAEAPHDGGGPPLSASEHLDEANELANHGDLAEAYAHALLASHMGEQEGAHLAEQIARDGGTEVVEDGRMLAVEMGLREGVIRPSQEQIDAAMTVQSDLHARMSGEGVPLNIAAEAEVAGDLHTLEQQAANGEEFSLPPRDPEAQYAPHPEPGQLDEAFLSEQFDHHMEALRQARQEQNTQAIARHERAIAQLGRAIDQVNERQAQPEEPAVEAIRQILSDAGHPEIADDLIADLQAKGMEVERIRQHLRTIRAQYGETPGDMLFSMAAKKYRGREVVPLEELVVAREALAAEGVPVGRINRAIADEYGVTRENVVSRLAQFDKQYAAGEEAALAVRERANARHEEISQKFKALVAQNAHLTGTEPRHGVYSQPNMERLVTAIEALANESNGRLPRRWTETIADRTGYTPGSVQQFLWHIRDGRFGEALQARARAIADAKRGPGGINAEIVAPLLDRGISRDAILKRLNGVREQMNLKPVTRGHLAVIIHNIRKGGGDPLASFTNNGRSIFESAVERVVAGSTTARATGSQWWATISRASGVKKEELQWLGLEDFLNAQEGQVAREDVLAFVRENGVRVEETVLGEAGDTAAHQQALLPLIEEQSRLYNELDSLRQQQRDHVHGRGNAAALHARRERINDITDRLASLDPEVERLQEEGRNILLFGHARRAGNTRWSQYALPGGENYRELLLTLPSEKADVRLENRAAIEWLKRNGVADPETEFGYRNPGDYVALARSRGWNGAPVESFRSSHFDQPNILAHVRFNERTDANGARTLFMEEVQSDWHQAGRERGYASPDRAKEIAEARSAFDAALSELKVQKRRAEEYLDLPHGEHIDNDQGFMLRELAQRGEPEAKALHDDLQRSVDALSEAYSRKSDLENGRRVPDAPFKNNAWASLSMKRMIRWAAENGFDQIAWTRGQHQIERFNLATLVERVSWGRREDGNYDITITRRDGGPAISRDNQSAADLAELIGQDAAKRITNDVGTEYGNTKYKGGPRIMAVGEITGGDLQTGGHGMRAFYDRILPNIANDLGKKFGARVGETAIDVTPKPGRMEFTVLDPQGQPYDAFDSLEAARQAARDAGPGYRVQEGSEVVHALPITSEMREAVMREGQPLFSRTNNGAFSNVEEATAIAEERYGVQGWAALRKGAHLELTSSRDALIAALDAEGRTKDADSLRNLEGEPAGVHFPRSKTTFLFTDHITPETLDSLLVHEVGRHVGMERFIGKKGIAEVDRHLARMVRENHPLVMRALEAAGRGSAFEHLSEELGAYTAEYAQRATDLGAAGKLETLSPEDRNAALAFLLEQRADLPIISKILASLRQWLVRKFGTTFGMRLTVEDIRQLALASLQRVAEQGRREGVDVAPVYVPAAQSPDAGAVGGEQRFTPTGEFTEYGGGRGYSIPLEDGRSAHLSIGNNGTVRWGMDLSETPASDLPAAQRAALGLRAMRGVLDALEHDAATSGASVYRFTGNTARSQLYRYLGQNADRHGFEFRELGRGEFELWRSARTGTPNATPAEGASAGERAGTRPPWPEGTFNDASGGNANLRGAPELAAAWRDDDAFRQAFEAISNDRSVSKTDVKALLDHFFPHNVWRNGATRADLLTTLRQMRNTDMLRQNRLAAMSGPLPEYQPHRGPGYQAPEYPEGRVTIDGLRREVRLSDADRALLAELEDGAPPSTPNGGGDEPLTSMAGNGNGQNRDNLVRKADAVDSPEYRDRLARVRSSFSEEAGIAGAEGQPGAGESVLRQPGSGEGRRVGSDPDATGRPGALNNILSVSGVRFDPKARKDGFGDYRAVIDTPFDTSLQEALTAPKQGGPTTIYFDLVDGSNPKDTRLPGVHLRFSRVNDALKGQGAAVWFYRQIIDWAGRRGLPTYSDFSVSPEAQSIYKALERRGYRVEQINRYVPDSDGAMVNRNFLPIFRVSETGAESRYDAAPLPREDYQIGSPQGLRDRIAEGDARAAESEAKFSMSSARQERPLIAVHNTTGKKLLHAIRMGGMAVPSLAVTRGDLGFSNFGDITLIAPPRMVDPARSGSKARVFNADAYSPRYPQISHKVNERTFRNLIERPIFQEASRDLGFKMSTELDQSTTQREGMDSILQSTVVQLAYARTHGIDVEIPTEKDWNGNERPDYYRARRELRDRVGEDPEFMAWAESQFAPAFEGERIFQGWTNAGNARYLPHNLDTVVRLLKKELRDGEGFNYGVGSIRAKVARQFRTMSEIKGERDQIVSHETMEALKKEADDEFVALANHFLEKSGRTSTREQIGFLDSFSEHLKEVADTRRASSMDQYYKEPLTNEDHALVVAFLEKLRHLPTEYFEAKVQRAVSLNEFAGAVVPDDTPLTVMRALWDNGIQNIRTYKKGDEAARREAVNAATPEDMKFSFAQRLRDMSDAYHALDPVDQAIADNPDMKIATERGEVSARQAIEMSVEAQRQAQEMKKGYDAAIRCAIRHGGSMAGSFITQGVTRGAVNAAAIGRGLGAALSVPAAMIAAPIIARNADNRWPNTPAAMDRRRQAHIEANRRGVEAGLDNPAPPLDARGQHLPLDVANQLSELPLDDAARMDAANPAPTTPPQQLIAPEGVGRLPTGDAPPTESAGFVKPGQAIPPSAPDNPAPGSGNEGVTDLLRAVIGQDGPAVPNVTPRRGRRTPK